MNLQLAFLSIRLYHLHLGGMSVFRASPRLYRSVCDRLNPQARSSRHRLCNIPSPSSFHPNVVVGEPARRHASSNANVSPESQTEGPMWRGKTNTARGRPHEPMGMRYSAEDLSAENEEPSDAVFRKHFVVDGSSTNFTAGSYINKPIRSFSQPEYVYFHEFDVHQGGFVAVVEMGNPQKANSLSSGTLRDLDQMFQNLAKRDDLRAIILTGCKTQGKPFFSAGANIKEMEALTSVQEAQAFIGSVFTACEAIRKCPVPTIARIDGLCFGAALEIASCCDFRYATWQSRFSMKEVALGIPSVIQARMLANIIGWQETKKMVLLGKDYGARTMQRFGFLDGQYRTALYLDHQIDSLINTIANNGPKATRAQKSLNRFWEENPLGPGIIQGIDTFAQMWEDGGSEPKKYMRAWLERTRRKELRDIAAEDDGEDDAAAEPPEAELAKPTAWNFLKFRDYTQVNRM